MKLSAILFCLFGLGVATAPVVRAADVISLKGRWRFALDPAAEGQPGEWFKTKLPDTIRLPGTTDENRKGPGNTNTAELSHLSRLHPYVGPAWYQREVVVPRDWQQRRITLFLERTKHTSVWLDQQPCGEQDSLAAPQVYDLSRVLAPGRHRLTVLVNNQNKPPLNGGHQLSEDTQTDWNGLLGRLELRATDKVWIEDAQVYPDAKTGKIKLRVTLGNQTGTEAAGRLEWRAQSWNASRRHVPRPGSMAFANAAHGAVIEAEYDLGPDALKWDEFDPALYRLALTMKAGQGKNPCVDGREIDFGLRDFSAQGNQFSINGKTIFLRGKHDACVFPLTGHPPMETEGWLRVFRIARQYGINHYRFHSWCPPEAAFAAADMAGIYLQPELFIMNGDINQKPGGLDYCRLEGERIFKAFGQHPSFVMFALGNEMAGRREDRAGLVQELRRMDPRHLYAQSSNYDFSQPRVARGDDYWTTFRTRPGAEGAVRGSFGHCDMPLGHVQTGPPSTTWDYAAALADVTVPVIGHEVGQYQAYPNFKEISKYKGVLRPWNLEVFRSRLAARNMLDQAPDFFRASGALAVRCYREDIEAALRTPGFGGFQLLDLQDFPGQGTALVGILDAFMDSKGFISPEKWREFCSATVPLALLEKRVWTNAETLTAAIKVANYGPVELPGSILEWALIESGGGKIASGELPAQSIPQGQLVQVGHVSVLLAKAAAPRKVLLNLRLRGSKCRNQYELWVYPDKIETLPQRVIVSHGLDASVLRQLAAGRRVLLLPPPTSWTNSVEGAFASDFWCYPMFRGICQGLKKPVAPGTLGLLCQPNHPAFRLFPTEVHSNWQWWSLLMHSRPLILDDTPPSFRPLAQVIDNFERNHKLGLIFEGRVGTGRLLVCAIDLAALADRPEARQLLASLVAYADSDRFAPRTDLSPALLAKLR